MESKRPTICLSMIVRDESHVILRCLESVKPFVDHWVIADTGSLDDTCVAARAFMHDIPGDVVHHHWKDFGHNRSEALKLAQDSGCDYILVIDADETLIVEDKAIFENLNHAAYRIEMRFPDISYPRVNLLKNDRTWRYVGVIHEYAQADPPAEEFMLDPSKIHMWTDGNGARGRSGTKLQRDLVIMEQAVEDEPRNPRYWFYLAQGYETCKRVPEAIEAYRHRAAMGDYLEEVYFSHYRMAHLYQLQKDPLMAARHYLLAYETCPNRAEPLFWLGLMEHNAMHDHSALLYFDAASTIDKPASALFVEPAVYDWQRFVHLAISLHNTGQRDDAVDLAKRILEAGKAPIDQLALLARIVGQEQAHV